MDSYLEDYIDDEFEDDMNIDIANQVLRKDMMLLVNNIPFQERRRTLIWNNILDKDGKLMDKPVVLYVEEFESDHIKAVLKWSAYDYEANTNLVLHTMKEELDYRNKINAGS